MNRTQATLFLQELRETAGSALLRLDELEADAAIWVQRQQELDAEDDEEDLDIRKVNETLLKQSRIFDNLEALLAALARVSLILRPAAKGSQAASRARELRDHIGVPDDSPLANRDLRNFWMHFDEHLDRAVRAGTLPARQWFTISTKVTAKLSRSLKK